MEHTEYGRYILAVGQLGVYEALIDYALKGLRGQTSSSPQEVAERIEARHKELIDEQKTILFKQKLQQ
jgi:hypothetical protein